MPRDKLPPFPAHVKCLCNKTVSVYSNRHFSSTCRFLKPFHDTDNVACPFCRAPLDLISVGPHLSTCKEAALFKANHPTTDIIFIMTKDNADKIGLARVNSSDDEKDDQQNPPPTFEPVFLTRAIIRDLEIFILITKSLDQMKEDAKSLGIECDGNMEELSTLTIAALDRARKDEDAYSLITKRDPTNFQTTPCYQCSNGPATKIGLFCKDFICDKCAEENEATGSCGACGDEAAGYLFLPKTDLPSSIPEDFNVPSSDENEASADPLEFFMSAAALSLDSNSPKKEWTDEELVAEFKLFEAAPTITLQRILLCVLDGNREDFGSRENCVNRVKKEYKKHRNLKSALYRLLGPGPHCSPCLKPGASWALERCRHLCCNTCLDKSGQLCPKCGDKWEKKLCIAAHL